ncbi:MAG: hypothetical protein HWN65_15680 [Candidatus Helarchaeota archaeon]|nr:hypothetical protein [Candidatus Helarchaeota archaeon]
MNEKKLRLAPILLLVLLCGTFCMPAMGFSETPTYIDDYNDHHQKDYPAEDIWKVWIDNNATHIMFKVECNGSLDVWTELGIYISTNDATGSNDSNGFAAIDGPLDFLADYCLLLDGDHSDFFDLGDGTDDTYTYGTNDIQDWTGSHTFGGLGYVIFSNGDRVVEIGYKLQATSGNQGYLDVEIGDTIKCKLKCYEDSDFAPDLGESPIVYTLTGEPDLTWVILLIILFPVIGVALGIFLYYRKKEVI